MEHFTCGSLGKTRSHTYLVGVLSALLAGTVSGGEEAYAAHAVVYGGACRKQRALSCRARHAFCPACSLLVLANGARAAH